MPSPADELTREQAYLERARAPWAGGAGRRRDRPR